MSISREAFEKSQTHIIYHFLCVAGEGYTSFFRIDIQQFGTGAKVLNEGSEHIRFNFPLILCILLIEKRMNNLDRLESEFVGFDDALSEIQVRQEQFAIVSVHTMTADNFHDETAFDVVGLVLDMDFASFNGGATLSIVGQSTFEDREQRLTRRKGYLQQTNCYSKHTLL